jgi:hypothetical protein
MSENLGTLYNTKIPSLSEDADIQEAFRLYHYGAPSGTSVGEYNPLNTNPNLIPTDSIAGKFYQLDSQLENISTILAGTVTAATWSAKGVLVSATAAATLAALPVGSNSQVLTVDSATNTGLRWASPEVTSGSTNTFINKTISLASNTITGTIAQFDAALSNASFATTNTPQSLVNKNLEDPIISGSLRSPSFQPIIQISEASNPANWLAVSNSASAPTISAVGAATNVSINMVPKGTGRLQEKGINVITSNQLVLSGAYTSSYTPGSTAVVTNGNSVANITLSNVGALVRLTSTVSNPTVNLPASAAVGATISFIQASNTNHNFVAPSGENIVATPGTRLRAQGSVATAVKMLSNQWALFGDLIA